MKKLENKFPDGSLSARLKVIQKNKEKELEFDKKPDPPAPKNIFYDKPPVPVPVATNEDHTPIVIE
jgi:hypothetical protein